MARSACSAACLSRLAGRLPMCSASSSATGVAVWKYSMNRGSSYTVDRNASRAEADKRSIVCRHSGSIAGGAPSIASSVAVV